MSSAVKCMELEITMLSKISHTQKDKYDMLYCICGEKKDMKAARDYLGEVCKKRKEDKGDEWVNTVKVYSTQV
jgi:hypothetical protein